MQAQARTSLLAGRQGDNARDHITRVVPTIRLFLANENDYYADMLFRSRYAVFLTAILVVAPVVPVHAFPSLGLQVTIVSKSPAPASIALVQNKRATRIYVDKADWAGVLRAASDLQADIQRVSGVKPEFVTGPGPSGEGTQTVGVKVTAIKASEEHALTSQEQVLVGRCSCAASRPFRPIPTTSA